MHSQKYSGFAHFRKYDSDFAGFPPPLWQAFAQIWFRRVSQYFASFRNSWFRKLLQAFTRFRKWTFARIRKCENHGFSQGFTGTMGTLLMEKIVVSVQNKRFLFEQKNIEQHKTAPSQAKSSLNTPWRRPAASGPPAHSSARTKPAVTPTESRARPHHHDSGMPGTEAAWPHTWQPTQFMTSAFHWFRGVTVAAGRQSPGSLALLMSSFFLFAVRGVTCPRMRQLLNSLSNSRLRRLNDPGPVWAEVRNLDIPSESFQSTRTEEKLRSCSLNFGARGDKICL